MNKVNHSKADVSRTTRDKLIEAAFRVVARDGLAEANVKAIAAEAGVTPGLLHYHFSSKDTLLEEAVMQGGAAYLCALDALVAAHPPETTFDAYVAFIDETLEAHRDLFRVRLALAVRAMNDTDLAGRMESANAAVRDRIATILGRGAGRSTPIAVDHLRARMVKAAFEGMMLAWLSQRDFPMREAVAEWTAMTRQRIAAEKP